MEKSDRIVELKKIVSAISKYNVKDIEEGTEVYFSGNSNYENEVTTILSSFKLSKDIEYLIELFELLLEQEKINENGIVFTPKYIADYIVEQTLNSIPSWSEEITILDPGCGGGIFLVSAAQYISEKFGVPLEKVIKHNIYGLDIESDNVRRCRIVLNVLLEQSGIGKLDLSSNILCVDSLREDWDYLFGERKINFVIGNPPYVNAHDMSKETVKRLKNEFITTKVGTFNIFYAFVEKAMNELDYEGQVGFIVPNNFLSITAATNLRHFLQSNKYLMKIIDFSDNMVFKPVRTYNCILQLSKKETSIVEYSIMDKEENIKLALNNISFSKIPISKLDSKGWNLVSEAVHSNLQKIENQAYSIKDYIRTGIATLKDAVYFVNKDNRGYFNDVEGVRMDIESDIVKPIYKIPELKNALDVEEVKRYIIFPYQHDGNGYSLLDESTLSARFPKTYEYLFSMRATLATRDKGKPVAGAWYAYGRNQGLNKYGKKLLFPTFSKLPRFMYVDDIDALFCNGYAVFENDDFDLEILVKILNSKIMDYYIKNTSYSIEGGYLCYQKKYIQNFSIPSLNSQELEYIKHSSKDDVDILLMKLYGLEGVDEVI